jgi:DNA-binding transcriptional ArsR family regulator
LGTKTTADHTGDAWNRVTRTRGSAISGTSRQKTRTTSAAGSARIRGAGPWFPSSAGAAAGPACRRTDHAGAAAVTPAPDGDCIVVDKLQDKATAARGAGVTFVPSVFGSPHPAVVHAPGRRPVVQYPVAEPDPSEPVPLETVTLRPEALGHPVRRRLLRTLARGPHTTRELAHARELTPPEVSRHLAVLRRAGLLTSRRQGRYVRYTLSLPGLTALGADLPAAVLR